MGQPKPDANSEFNPTNVKEKVAQKKRHNFRYAFGCAILASMTSILLGYGN
jgi:hypothetical protein